jgi:uncharacterized Zn finger protein
VQLCEETELTAADALAIAKMLQARRKPAEALTWVERGLALGGRTPGSLADHDLRLLERELLRKVGRGADALAAAWREFEQHPDKYTYEELVRYVPAAERAAWHAKAMDAAVKADLSAQIELWLETGERARLVDRLRRARDAELEDTSHYATEPAATALAEAHPDVAAKVYRALGLRILREKKSKYYGAALSHLEAARRCYERAGLRGDWEALVDAIRADHRRKVGFMPGFEEVVAGGGPSAKPSFIARAKARWAKPPG